MSKTREKTKPPEEYTPKTADERITQLERIADKILNRIESGACSVSEREKLIKSYDAIDRILYRHYNGAYADDEPLREILERWDTATMEGGQ